MQKTILVVDDSESVRQAVCGALKEAGYDVIEACDGEDALGKIGTRKIHLIICDVIMPRMDGIAFVKAIRCLEGYRFTPVIMLTIVAQEGRKQEGWAAGAKAWVVKPFLPAQMLTAVSKLIMR